MINQPLKDLHSTLGIHDPELWTSKNPGNNDEIKVCSCGAIWWNGEIKPEDHEFAPKFWYFGPDCPEILKQIVERMGGLGTACACGVRRMWDMADATEAETGMFARTMGDMITHKRPLPPKKSVPESVGLRLLEHNEMDLMLRMKTLDLFE